MCRRIGTSEEENLLHDRGGTDIKFEQSFYVNNPIAKLFFDLFPDPLFGRGAVELPGAGLQRILFSILEEYGQPQLPRKQHHIASGIIGKNDSRVSAIVDLALAPLLFSIAPALGITDAHQLAFLALHERLDVTDVHRFADHSHGQ